MFSVTANLGNLMVAKCIAFLCLRRRKNSSKLWPLEFQKVLFFIFKSQDEEK